MQRLLAACALSVVVHVGLLWFVPRPIVSSPPQLASLDEVELVSIPLPAPVVAVPVVPDPPLAVVQEKTDLVPEAVPESQPLPEVATPPPLVVVYDASQIRLPDAPRMHATVAQLSTEASAPLALPLQLPSQQLPAVLPDLPPPSVPDMARATLALLEPAAPAAARVPGLDKPPAPAPLVGEQQRPGDLSIPALDRQLLTRVALPSAPVPSPPSASAPAGIQGPVAQREPVYRPPVPKVRVDAAGEITLKFWVRPDGVVSRILPERKGDIGLEVAAMRYLERWRFTPLLPYEPQVEQWGTITVRFLMQER